MIFGPNPKDDKKDLYDRKSELGSLIDSLKRGERMAIIYGVRRTGKTSLMRVFLNEREVPYALIDVKSVYFEHGYVPMAALNDIVMEQFSKFAAAMGLEANVTYDIERPSFTALLGDIDEWCNGKRLRFAVALDEAQYLRFGGRVRYDGLLAWGVDNLKSMMFILTGSEVGVLRDFLRYDDPKAPLYDRFKNEIYLERLDRESSLGFLSKGFAEQKKGVEKAELDRVTDRLDGVIGWLSYYGYYRTALGLDERRAMDRVFREGSMVVLEELENLISKSRKRYLTILNAIAKGETRWIGIKAYTYAKAGRLSDATLSELLASLIKFGIVEKKEETYRVIDPVLKRAVEGLKG